MAATDVLDEALRLLSVDSRRAEVVARRAVTLAEDERDARTQADAERVLGLAAVQQGSPTAVRHLRSAVRLARRCGAADLEGRARMSLATVLAASGHGRQALHELELATPLTADANQAAAQRGLLLHLIGRHDEAVEAIGSALHRLRRGGDENAILAALINRGAAHLSRADATSAAVDLAEAVRRAEGLGLIVDAALARTNLAHAHTLEGRVPEALSALSAAEADLRSTGTSVAAPLSMRAELFVSVRLLGEASEAAQAALAAFQRERNRSGAADTYLLLAQIHARAGALAAGRASALRARRAFRAQGRYALAALGTAWFAAAGGRVPQSDLARAAETVAAAGWRLAEIETRILVHRLAGRRGAAATDQLHRAARWRSGPGPAEIRARAWYAQALLLLAQSRLSAAQRAARRGLAILDEHRASLPATDLRAASAAHRIDLARLGLRIALSVHAGRDALTWVERGRATSLLQGPVRPPDDRVLAERTAALRQIVVQMYGGRVDGTPAADFERLRARQVRLEREIRDLAREAGGDHVDPVGRPADLRDLGTALGGRALVEYVLLDGALHAVTLVDNRCRLHHLGAASVVAGLLERVPFAVQRMIRAARSPRGAAAATTLLADAGRRLDEILLAPLRETDGRELVVVPTGMLQALPWSVLPSCRGRALTVSPSATVWLAATRRPANPGHAVVAAGPRLPSAPAEAKAVATLYRTEPVVDPDARVDAVMASLSGAAVAHLATHGRLSAENPLFSHLLLSDGPLVVYDLERLPSLPHTVVLAACDSGRHVVRAGDELLGLGAAFLAGGTAQLVASVVPVPDAETATLMAALHTGLAGGTPPAVALAQAQAAVAGSGAVAEATAAGFVCIGAGFVPVPFALAGREDAAGGSGPTGHQPRARQAGSDGRSTPSVVSLP